MKVNVYSIKDVKEGFQAPYTRVNDKIAIRDFLNVARSPEPNKVTMNPEDFELWRIGTMETETGVISSGVEFLASALGVTNENSCS